MEAIIIISVILLVICIGALFWGIQEGNGPLILFSIILIVVITIQLGFIFDVPSALNVYQGKTTLQITYRDSIPVDSVVVFK